MAGGSLAAGEAGASPNHRKRKAPVPVAAAEDEAESEKLELGREVEELEEGLAYLDRRILEHLRGTATRLADTGVDRLASLRPPARLEFPIVSETSAAEEDQQLLEKLKILKTKIEANIADLPKVYLIRKNWIPQCLKSMVISDHCLAVEAMEEPKCQSLRSALASAQHEGSDIVVTVF